MTSVVDASLVVNALVPGVLQARTRQQLELVEAVSPALIGVEVLSAVARLERARTITRDQADEAVRRWTTLPVERVSVDELTSLVWSLRGPLRIADAHYAALALALEAPLLTADRRLAAAPVPGLTVVVVQ